MHNSNPRHRAAVAVARLAAVAREAKEGLTPAAGEETEASWRLRRRRWRHGPVPRQGVRGRERQEGFDACGEEDRGERPARDGDDAGTGGSSRVAAPRPHRQQLRRHDAAHSESTVMVVMMATGWEHEDKDGGGDCEDVTTEGGSHRSLGDRVLRGRWGRGAVVVMAHV
jgi:hypothetical protein